MDELYEKFLSRENFELAYSRIKHWPKNAYKFFYKTDIEAFEVFLSNNLEQLISEIQELKYRPERGCVYYIPKKNYLSRPITLLNFLDLLVYQAITNVVMETFKDKFATTDDRIVFGNIINKDNNSSYFFQFKNWKSQWRTYKQVIKESFKQGYKYISEFDIASFYDCIDHERLLAILRNNDISGQMIDLMERCLQQWTISQTANSVKRCGIPQGPECSGFWGELYLREIDKQLVNCHLDIKYFRYADDMKIMSNDEQVCHKAIALLDFYCKDSCLIAQSGKIATKELDNRSINEYINSSGLKLSNITYEFKSTGKIKESTHNNLKKKLKAVFNKDSILYLDKTVIKFAFFKLNKDDEVKNIILSHWNELYLTFEGPIYYLNKYYTTDKEVLDKIHTVLLKDDTLFQYNKAIIFDLFDGLPFYTDVYESVLKNGNKRYWIVKYYAIKWLYRVNKTELTKFLITENENYFLDRENLKNNFQHTISNEERRQLAKKHYNNGDMLSLIAFCKYPIYESFSEDDASDYILNILKLNRADYIGSFLKSEFGITKTVSKKFINRLEKNKDVYHEAIKDLYNYNELKNSKYPDMALQFIDLWHNIIIDLVLPNTEMEFGNKIEQIKNILPCCYNGFKILHDARNQKTSAHYKDKSKNVRKMITADDFKKLITNASLQNAYIELCDYFKQGVNINESSYIREI